MSVMTCALDSLTQKEKETLRLIVRGHDAKTAARELALSVHTINERLRASRRKLGVTSSREAARLLFEREGGTPKNLGYEQLGDVPSSGPSNPDLTTKTSHPWPLWITGVLIVLSITTLTAFLLSSGSLVQTERAIGEPATPIENAQIETFEASSRSWLALVDASNWPKSFEEAGQSFQVVNTVKGWAEASRQARAPLGAVLERKALTAEFVAAPPMGYTIMHFQTRFENRANAHESVTLERENDEWKVVGYVID